MFYGDTIQETRQIFFTSWDKYQHKKTLSPLEKEVANVILAHPEYHYFIENPEKFHEHTYYPEFGETNPGVRSRTLDCFDIARKNGHQSFKFVINYPKILDNTPHQVADYFFATATCILLIAPSSNVRHIKKRFHP